MALAPATAAAGDGGTLERYAQGTWQSFVAMTDERTGLPTDLLHGDGSRDIQTSTTNIGAYMWSAVAAEKLGLIGRRELLARMDRTVTTIEGMETLRGDGPVLQLVRPPHRREDDDRQRRRAARADPVLRRQRLARGRPKIVGERVPQLRSRTRAIYDAMDFGFYYRPEVNRILFHYAPDTGAAPCCYDTIVSESRIAYYVGVAKGDLPSKVFYGPVRTFPETCAGSFQETRPEGFTRTYEGQSVYEGTYPTATGRLVPSWGGSMFEALMPTLFVPEEEWGPASWRVNHPNTVDAQIDHGINVAGYGAWGFSPSADTDRRLRDLRRRRRRHGPERERVQPRPHAGRPRLTTGLPAARRARPAAERLHERRRHAARHVPRPALAPARGARLAREARARLRRVHKWGFYDAVNVGHGEDEGRPLGLVPLARPGDDHGRARQRARP